MKVVFLDIDGVLNGIEYVKITGRAGIVIDPVRMQRLKEIIDKTDAEIVLSTSWREHWSVSAAECDALGDYLNKLFREYGLTIYDKTPQRYFDRTAEITDWLHDYPNVTQYVLLDDLDFTSEALRTHHIKTSDDVGGLTEEDVRRAVEILESK